jgi:hypothetical protein
MDSQAIIKRQSELEALRLPEEKLWRETAELIRPEEADFAGPKSPRGYDEVFDSSPIYANDDFVGGLFGQSSSPAVDWFGYGVPDEDLMAWQPVKLWFDKVTTIVKASLSPNASTFYTSVAPVYGDVGCFGIGVQHQEEDVGRQRILDRAIPLKEIYIDLDGNGDVDTVHRKFVLNGRQFVGRFGAVEGVTEQKMITIIHAVYPNPDHEPGRAGPRGKAWSSCYCSTDVKDWSQTGGYHEMPYHVAMWDQRSGRVYPRGPGHTSRADARQLNEMERSHIVAAQFAAEPMKLLHGDSDLTAADISPNALLYGTMSEAGKQLMQVLNTGGNLQLSLQQSEQRRQSIRNAFRFSMMALANRPQMTATEYLGWQEETLRLMGHNLVKIQTTHHVPFLKRRFAILNRAGQFPPPPPELEGQMLAVGTISPFDKAQSAARGRATLQWVGAIAQMAAIDPEAFDEVDTQGVGAVLHDAFGPPPKVRRDPGKVEEIRQRRAQQQQQSQQLEQAGQAVKIAAEASHAEQASSLASKRVAA